MSENKTFTPPCKSPVNQSFTQECGFSTRPKQERGHLVRINEELGHPARIKLARPIVTIALASILLACGGNNNDPIPEIPVTPNTQDPKQTEQLTEQQTDTLRLIVANFAERSIYLNSTSWLQLLPISLSLAILFPANGWRLNKVSFALSRM